MLAIHAMSTENDEVRSLSSKKSGIEGPFAEEGAMKDERMFSKVKRHLKTLSILGVHVGAALLLRNLSFRFFSK
jgi:hypothetical protein